MTTVSTLERDISRFSRAQTMLQATLGEDVYGSFFRRLSLEGVDDGVAHLSVPTIFLKSWIAKRYSERLISCMRAADIEVSRVDITVRPLDAHALLPVPTVTEDIATLVPKVTPLIARGSLGVTTAIHDGLGGSPLTPQFTFDSFVKGRSNSLAHAAAHHVAEAHTGDVRMFNPLYIHGDSGRGKTHLAQAICWGATSQRVLYLTVENFMHNFVHAVRSRSVTEYKHALRDVDTLVLDDVQLLRGKSVQTEFLHACKALMASGHQIVVTADRPPQELEGFEDILTSQFSGGLVVEICAHDEELRSAILETKLKAAQVFQPGFQLPEEAVSYLAHVLTEGGRSLELAIMKLRTRYALTRSAITMDDVVSETKSILVTQEPTPPKVETVQRVVARHYNVSRGDLLSSNRTARVVRPRHVAMYLCKILTPRSLPEIGRRFGGRDHTTVLSAIRKMERLVQRDAAFADEIAMFKKMLAA